MPSNFVKLVILGRDFAFSLTSLCEIAFTFRKQSKQFVHSGVVTGKYPRGH